MTDATTQPEAKPSVMDRPIKLKFVLVIAGLLIAAALVILVAQYVGHSGEMSLAREQLRESAETKASILAHAVSVFGNKMIVAKEYNQLQEYADNLIASKDAKDILYIAVVDQGGQAVVHTDRRYRGRSFSGDIAEPGVLTQASAKVMDLTKQAGTVYVGLRADTR